mgnify:CR=1 FL=1
MIRITAANKAIRNGGRRFSLGFTVDSLYRPTGDFYAAATAWLWSAWTLGFQ